MRHATFHTAGVKKTPTQLHTANPKDSPGRGALDGGHKKQNCETVRSELRKTPPGKGKRF